MSIHQQIKSEHIPYFFTFSDFSFLAWKYGILEREKSLEDIFHLIQKLFSHKILEEFFMKVEFCRLRTEKAGVQILTYFDKNYPFLLKQIHHPPLVLFYRGNLELLQKNAIAIVGTRSPSPISIFACSLLPNFLRKNKDSVMVSGLAVGIDREAMFSCLRNEVGVIGVMGTGFDKFYPTINKDLYKAMFDSPNALVLTEMRWEEPIGKWSFPKRNRIITGLSELLIIMESPLDSGAMSSASHAISQNRDILIFDHPESLKNEGGRKLLSEGANLLTLDDLVTGNKKIMHVSELFPKDYKQISSYLQELSKLELEGFLKPKGAGYYELNIENLEN